MDSTLTRARELYLAGEAPTLDTVPCVCTGPRVEHTGKTHAGSYEVTGCIKYRADRLQLLAAQAAAAAEHTFADTMRASEKLFRARSKKKPKGTVSVRPSDIGSCRRAVYYREAPPEDYVPEPSPKGAAWMGTLIHEEFLRRRATLYRWRMYGDQPGMEVQLPGSERGYRYDEYDPITARLISIKTAGSWRWDVTGQDGADPKWVDQDHAYGWALIQKGYPVETIEVLVIERESGKSERFVEPYDEARALRVLNDLDVLKTEIELGGVPPRDEPGPSNSKLCSTYCPARSHCWAVPLGPVSLGRSPENLVILGLNPDEEIVAEIAEELVGLRQQRLDISKDEKKLAALLDGVDLKPYNEVEGVSKPTSGTAWNEYRESMEELYRQIKAGEITPAELPDEPPAPRTSRGRSVTWQKLRKATRDKIAKAKKEQEAKKLEAPEPAMPPLVVVAERVQEPEPLALTAGTPGREAEAS